MGFDEARGDVITVKSLPFAALSGDGTLAERAGPLDRLDPNSLIRLALVGLFALVIAAVVLPLSIMIRACSRIRWAAALAMATAA